MNRSTLYPEILPFASGHMAVDPVHSVYWEQCGNPDGDPVLFVHGGPGAGCSARDRRFFDPDHFRIILVDQRGAGRSRPVGAVESNTTQDLVSDFERLREELSIDRWHVFGGSWGSTLGLYYAQCHPRCCKSLVMRGIWLFREQDLNWWFYQVKSLKPERWRKFAGFLPAEQRDDLLQGYWQILTGDDEARALEAARVWSEYEIMCCTLLPNPDFAALFEDDDAVWSLARLEAHYFLNNRFQPDNRLLDQVALLADIPTIIVHGRYDVICPVSAADELHRSWPGSSLVIVEDAGHSSIEPGITRELVRAMDRIRDCGSPVIVD